MRRTAHALSLLGILLTSMHLTAELAPLSIDDLYATPNLFGTSPSGPVWSPDSQQFAFTWNANGMPSRELWLSLADGSDKRRLSTPGQTQGPPQEFLWLDKETLLGVYGEELWSSNTTKNTHQRLASIGPGASTLSLAPDGRHAAYLQDGDLWLFDLERRSSRRVTDLGLASLSTLESAAATSLPAGRYSRREREVGPGIWGGPRYSWSPDSKRIALHIVDRSHMRKVSFPNYLAGDTAPNPVRRGYPGDANESRRVGLLNLADNSVAMLDLGDPSANQVVGFSWSPTGTLLVDMASDTAVDRWLYTVVKNTVTPTEIWHSHRPSRIYTAFASAWHSDGEQVIFLSDLADRYGLYAIDTGTGDKTPQRLTPEAFDVLSSPTVLQSANAVLFAMNSPNSHERQLYRLDLDDSQNLQRLTTMSGQHRGYPSPDGRFIADMHDSDTSPPDLYSVAVDGSPIRRVTQSPQKAFREREWARARYVSFPSLLDDYTLHARILEPATLEPGKKYPVLFGPMYSNTARNRWSGRYSRIQQLLVQKGYIVVQVDVRGSTGYGRAFREEFLVDFAGDDIEDIVSAVEYLKTQPQVDTERLGIWGSSYGGTLSIYTLLKKPGLFRAGVAAAAAVDPHFFGTDDVAIVRRPDTHPEVYLNRAETLAHKLEDHLLIIHGMQDQVVPFKTTAALAEALIREGKDFDFAFAPGATHSWSREAYYSRYLFGKMLQHFDRYLGPSNN